VFVVNSLPKLALLDFKKVGKREREQALAFFEGAEGGNLLGGLQGAEAPAPEAAKDKDKKSLTEEQKAQVRRAIEAAATKEEIDLIEKQLKVFPSFSPSRLFISSLCIYRQGTSILFSMIIATGKPKVHSIYFPFRFFFLMLLLITISQFFGI
jgi:hypothetical protein